MFWLAVEGDKTPWIAGKSDPFILATLLRKLGVMNSKAPTSVSGLHPTAPDLSTPTSVFGLHPRATGLSKGSFVDAAAW